MGDEDDISLRLSSLNICLDFRSTNIVQLSNPNLYFYRFRCHHPLITQLTSAVTKNLGLGCNSGLCSADHLLIMHPSSVLCIKSSQWQPKVIHLCIWMNILSLFPFDIMIHSLTYNNSSNLIVLWASFTGLLEPGNWGCDGSTPRFLQIR